MSQTYQWNSYLAEAIGTFLFFFVGIGAGYALFGESWATVAVAIALAHGLALLVVVSAFGAVSGGHFNPAVTFGLLITGKIQAAKAAGYVVAQLVGAVAAAGLVRYIYPEAIPSTAGLPALSSDLDVVKGIVAEAGVTMLLLTAVLGTAVDNRAAKIGGIAIGLAVAAGILMAGNLTGGALNPARWFGPAVIAGDFSNALVWIVGPLLGAGIVAIVYRFLILPQAEEEARATADEAS
jgi:aquaporin TIP